MLPMKPAVNPLLYSRSKQLLNTPLAISDGITREIASHCAVLTLELEKAQRAAKELAEEVATLRTELAGQRQVARVIAFPRGKTRKRR